MNGQGITKRGRALVFKRISMGFLVCLVLLEGALIALLYRQVSDQVQTIARQRDEIRELRERLQILNAIEDHQRGLAAEEMKQLADIIYSQSKRNFFDPFLILALIITESSFCPDRVSEYGACGLMQIMPATAAHVARQQGQLEFDAVDLFNPVTNVRLGIDYLVELISKFGSVKHALIAYNMGESTFAEYRYYKAEPPGGFHRRVVETYRSLKSRYGVPAE